MKYLPRITLATSVDLFSHITQYHHLVNDTLKAAGEAGEETILLTLQYLILIQTNVQFNSKVKVKLSPFTLVKYIYIYIYMHSVSFRRWSQLSWKVVTGREP